MTDTNDVNEEVLRLRRFSGGLTLSPAPRAPVEPPPRAHTSRKPGNTKNNVNMNQAELTATKHAVYAAHRAKFEAMTPAQRERYVAGLSKDDRVTHARIMNAGTGEAVSPERAAWRAEMDRRMGLHPAARTIARTSPTTLGITYEQSQHAAPPPRAPAPAAASKRPTVPAQRKPTAMSSAEVVAEIDRRMSMGAKPASVRRTRTALVFNPGTNG